MCFLLFVESLSILHLFFFITCEDLLGGVIGELSAGCVYFGREMDWGSGKKGMQDEEETWEMGDGGWK